jgi:hypothetical protein
MTRRVIYVRPLYTGARRDSEILCWDIRHTSEVLYRCTRAADTNQRVGFDIEVGPDGLNRSLRRPPHFEPVSVVWSRQPNLLMNAHTQSHAM